VQKKFQRMLSSHLGEIYGIDIPTINGDTKATSQSRPNETRLGLINKFCTHKGFAICILSPIAAGAGLNIVAANHVVHLERHWNPAKEDQATDRTFRIGQTKNVQVYLPLLKHPEDAFTTFDLGLHRLISKKRDVAGSVGFCPVQSVTDGDIFGEVFRPRSGKVATPPRPLNAGSLENISAHDFEALVAALFAKRASEAYVASGCASAGVHVVVQTDDTLGNALVHCKATSGAKLTSDASFRQVLGAQSYVEEQLGMKADNVVVVSMASGLSRSVRKEAKESNVEFLGRDWIVSMLKRYAITRADLIDQQSRRRRL